MPLQVFVLLSLLALSSAMDSTIVGGKEAKRHSRPYMVSLQLNGDHTCGGFLIRKDFVLTAAHCYNDKPDASRKNLEVVLGAHNIKKQEASQQRIKVKNYFYHPKYKEYRDAGNWKNLSVDIMVLKLKTNATLNKSVKVLALPKKKGETPPNVKCTIAGWGMRQPKGKASDVLYETSLKLLDQSKCKKIWQHYYYPDCMMCTATAKDNAFCQGDSGGPLMCNNKPQGLAIYTYRPSCNDPHYPGVYLNISTFLDWIKKVLGTKA